MREDNDDDDGGGGGGGGKRRLHTFFQDEQMIWIELVVAMVTN